MRTALPVYVSIYGQYGSDLVQTFYWRQQPNPNQAGAPGTLPDLTSALFKARVTDLFDAVLPEIPNLGTYVSGGSAGQVNVIIPESVVESIDPGTYRYRISMQIGSYYTPVFAGAFMIAGDAPQVVIAPPGGSGTFPAESVGEILTWGP